MTHQRTSSQDYAVREAARDATWVAGHDRIDIAT
jgi:hypothetical protein